MAHINRAFMVFVLIGLLRPGFSKLAVSADGAVSEEPGRTCHISGTVGMPDVILQGMPGEPLTDSRGQYRATVEYGWSGTVTPRRDGCQFEPPSRTYRNIIEDLSNQDYIVSRAGVPGMPTFGVLAPDIVVIPTREADLQEFAQIKEDMQVMVHILREKLREPRTILGVLYDYGDFFPGGRDIRAIYLQGHGALFMMDVDFPLSFPSGPRGEDEPKENEPIDPVWQRARQQLYAPPGAMRYGTRGQPSGADAVSFEQFKEDLVKTLRHAANIRNIEPNEWIILTVVGRDEAGFGMGSSAGGMRGMGGMMGGYGGGMTSGGAWVQGGGYGTGGGSFGGGGGAFGGGGGFYMDSRSSSGTRGGRAGGRPGQSEAPSPLTTVLTIQAQKIYIDALANDDIDLGQFQQKVKIFTY